VSTTLLDRIETLLPVASPPPLPRRLGPELARKRLREAGSGAGARNRRAARQRATRAADGSLSHIPVLADELLELLDPRPGQTAIDCTFGDGGHARLVAERLGASGTLIAIDRDPLAERRCAELAAATACTVRFIRSSYAEALELLAEEGLQADAAYFDLGMSSMQVDARERGFSYAFQAPLDMRMDPGQELSAREAVATWDERRLAQVLREYGEERHAGAIAREIVRRRAQQPIETTQELVETITNALPAPARFAGGHPAKRSFQALRIAVNDELGQLDRALPLAWGLLHDGGVLAGISFHSLEDRRVKRFLAARAQGCICPPDLPVCACGREPEAALLSRRSVVPSPEEVESNPRASSARLRAARKLRSEVAE
jgi:16S rRNA (cytosine1402-N4)-methyltransferase